MKIKHKFRVHDLVDSYPTSEDLLFDIINFLNDRDINNQEEWSDLGVRGSLSKKITDEKYQELLDELTTQKFIILRPGKGKRNYYTIIKNPF